uniref:Uncharacterized protein LOC111121434 n=1 Tax=Crassostrea virginica TaxID=6565 RepID=A0A8B8CRH0_CRAVI|nr:uncharacterized protein LOC111121434 [Crassostrea virginica]XP_022318432.1 uncharacterized protein LOC111121434 [Crassostrea virginica]
MERGVLREGFTVILLFICTPWGLQASPPHRKDLYINSTKSTWEDASRSCSLLGSDRSPSYDVNAQEIPVLEHRYRGGRPQAGRILYWIGAAANFTPWFELLGCQVIVPTQTVSTLTNLSLVIGPVADCYKQCNNHFGINETHCYCPSTLKGNFNNYSCGLSRFPYFKTRTDVIGKNNTGRNFDFFYQFAMYKVLDNFKLTTEDTLDECLIKSTTTGEMTTRPCDAADSSGQTWIDSVLQGLPLEGPGPGQWTPYTRRRLLRWTAGNENIPKRTACVSWSRVHHQNEIVLRPCDESLAYICQIKNDPITSASTTTSPFIWTEPRDRNDTTAKVDAIATTAMMSRDLTPTLSPQNENEASVLPVIAGSVAAGFIFVLIIAAIIILRVKRRASFKQQSVSAATENVYYSGLADEQTPLQGITPSSADDRMTDKSDKTSPDSKERGQPAPGDEDGVYNHTWDKPITEKQTDHVYSSVHSRNEYDFVNSDVYNNTWDKPITAEITDHVYSSTSSGNDANVYDHTNSRNLNSSELNGDDYGVNPK